MAYDPVKLKKEALKLIIRDKLNFHSHIAANMGITLKSYYNHGLNVDEDIIIAMNVNRVNNKTKLISKMADSDSTGSQIFLYRLLADEEEKAILDGQDKKTDVEPIQVEINLIKPE